MYRRRFYVLRDMRHAPDGVCLVSDDACHVLDNSCDVSGRVCNVSDSACYVSDDTCYVSDDTCYVSDDVCYVPDDVCQVSGDACKVAPWLTKVTQAGRRLSGVSIQGPGLHPQGGWFFAKVSLKSQERETFLLPFYSRNGLKMAHFGKRQWTGQIRRSCFVVPKNLLRATFSFFFPNRVERLL